MPPEDVGQHVDGGLAALLLPERQVGALRRLDALERADVDALFGGEARRRRRRAVRGEARGHGRAGDQLLEIGLAFGETRAIRTVSRRGVL